MPTEIKKFSELDKILKENKIKYISLWDSEGKIIFTQNATPAGMLTRKKEIYDFLASALAQPGYYTIKLKNNPQKQGASTDIIYTKIEPGLAEGKSPLHDHAYTNFLSYERALELEKKLAGLEYEVKSKDLEIEKLKKEILELQEENQDLSEDLERKPETPQTQPTGLTEGAPVVLPGKDLWGISPHIPTIMGAVDAWFKLKEKELDLKARQNSPEGNRQQSANPDEPKQITEAEAINLTAQTLEYLKKSNPEILNQLIDKYGTGKAE